MQWIEGKRPQQGGGFAAVKVGIQGKKIAKVKIYSGVDLDLPTLYSGFIDMHVHGGGGADTMDATPEAFAEICATHARFGTTSLLLTTVSERYERIDAVLEALAMWKKEEPDGARILGVHLEGPFIHPHKAGAQRKDCIVAPDLRQAEHFFATGLVKMITLAPELPGARDIARVARQYGIVVSAGHTEATANEMDDAHDAGFSHVTHLCNAMPGLHHREVGPIGSVMTREDYTADFICDGIHLHPMMVKLLVGSIGTDRMVLITDAMRAATMQDGTYDLGGLTVQVTDGACRLSDGTLAGSVLTMARAVALVQQFAGVSPYDAQKMASMNPAKKLGYGEKGQLQEGYDADIYAVDALGNTEFTMVEGRISNSL